MDAGIEKLEFNNHAQYFEEGELPAHYRLTFNGGIALARGDTMPSVVYGLVTKESPHAYDSGFQAVNVAETGDWSFQVDNYPVEQDGSGTVKIQLGNGVGPIIGQAAFLPSDPHIIWGGMQARPSETPPAKKIG